MRVSRSALLVTLASSPLVTAAPTTCNPVDAVYALLKLSLQAKASSWCLAYLGGDKVVRQTQTQTVTGAGRTATTTLPDQTATATNSVTEGVTVTITQDVAAANPTTTETVTATAGTRTVYQKRDATATAAVAARADIPPRLASYAASRISSACRCIATPTSKTVTTTQTQNVAGPQATQTIPGQSVTVTVVQTVQVTTQQTATRVVSPTSTVTETFTTTVTPILVKPKICNARGLPGPNAFNYDANFNTNQAACIASCKTDNRCLATGFYIVTDPSSGSQTGTCRKYDKSVTDSADLGPGYYNFNDKAC